MDKTIPFVSVIIPVWNNAKGLKTCLEALKSQTYPDDCYEIIVVDNNSDKKVENTIVNMDNLVLTNEAVQSVSAARNKGISISRGDILAFTDSDCIPESNWIEKGVQYLIANPECGLVAGRIKVFPENPEKQTAVELYETVRAFTQDNFIKWLKFGATANVFTRRSVIDDLGPFDPSILSGADVEWGNRVYNWGYKLFYYEGASVRHPARRSFGEIYRKTIRVSNGWYYLNSKSNTGQLGYILKTLRVLIPPVIRIVKFYNKEKVRELGSVNKRLKVTMIYIILRYVETLETIRLLLGGKPRYYF